MTIRNITGFINKTSPLMKWTMKKRLLFAAIPFTIFLLTFLFMDELAGVWALRIVSLLLTALSFLDLRKFDEHHFKHIMEEMKKNGKLPYDKNVQMCFDEDSFINISEMGEMKVAYTGIEKVYEGTKHIYIYVNVSQAHIIPLHVFESEAQKDEFLAFIRR